jgi:hypothetical protein
VVKRESKIENHASRLATIVHTVEDVPIRRVMSRVYALACQVKVDIERFSIHGWSERETVWVEGVVLDLLPDGIESEWSNVARARILWQREGAELGRGGEARLPSARACGWGCTFQHKS